MPPIHAIQLLDLLFAKVIAKEGLSHWFFARSKSLDTLCRRLSQATEEPTFAWDFWMALCRFSVPLSRTGLAVRFTITKSETRLIAEDGLTNRNWTAAKKPSPSSEHQTPPYQIDDALAIIRREAQGLDAYYVLREFEAFAKASETPLKNPLGALTMFARKKREQDVSALF